MNGDDEQELLEIEAQLKDLAIRRKELLFAHALANNMCVASSYVSLHPFSWDTMSDVQERSAVLRQVRVDLSVGKYVIHHNIVRHVNILTTFAPH